MKPFVTPGRPEEERQADDTERPIKAGGSVQQLRTAIHNAVSCGLEVCVEEGLIKATDAHFDLVVRRLAAEGARSFQVSLAPRRHRDGADARRVRDLPDTDVATAARRETTTAARSELATAALRDLIDSCPDGVSIAVTHVPRCMLEPRHRKHVACATESRRAWTAREGGHGGRQRARGGADSPDDLDAWSAADPPAAFSRPAACGECLSVVCCPGLPADYLGSAWEDSLRPVRVIPPDEERDYQAYMANVLGGYLQTAVGPSATRVLDAFCGYPAKNLAALKRACPLATVDLFDAKVTPNTDRFVCLDLGDADLPFVDPFDLMKLFVLAETELRRVPKDRDLFSQQVKFEFVSVRASMEKGLQLGNRLLQKLDVSDNDRTALYAAFKEGVENAAAHGNKFDPEKRIIVTFVVDPNRATFLIEDEGEGFDHVYYMAQIDNKEAFERAKDRIRQGNRGGLGILLMHKCSDRLEYSGRGNIVRIEKGLS